MNMTRENTTFAVPLGEEITGTLNNMIFVPAHMALTFTDAPVIGVKLGDKGFWPVWHPSYEELNKRPASEAVLRSAIQASMFGWDAPCAREALAWLDEGENAQTS
jgi:hypothetical protein